MFYEIHDIYCKSYCQERVGFILAEIRHSPCGKENCFCYLPSDRVRCIIGKENRIGALAFLRICSAGFLTSFCQTFLSLVLQRSRAINKRVSSSFTYYWKLCCTAQYCASWSDIKISVSSQKKQKCMLVRLVLLGKCI